MRFILIDRLLSLEPGQRVTAEMTFPPSLEIFADHFPGAPIVPGTLLVEAMAQTGGWLLAAMLNFDRWPALTAVDQAKFYKFAAPAERIHLAAVVRAARGFDYEVHSEARSGDRRLSGARLLFHAQEMAPDGEASRAFKIWSRETFARLGGDALLARQTEAPSAAP